MGPDPIAQKLRWYRDDPFASGDPLDPHRPEPGLVGRFADLLPHAAQDPAPIAWSLRHGTWIGIGRLAQRHPLQKIQASIPKVRSKLLHQVPV